MRSTPGEAAVVVLAFGLVIKRMFEMQLRFPETHEIKWAHAFRIGAKRGGFAEAMAVHFGGSLTDPV